MTEPKEDQAKIERQIELERKWIDKGIEDYYEARERQSEAHLPPGIRLMRENMEKVIEGIKEFCDKAHHRQKPIVDFLSNFKLEEIASVTVSACINAFAIGEEKQRRTALTFQIAEQLVTKRNYDILIRHAEEKYRKAKAEAEREGKKKRTVFNEARYIETEISKLRQYFLKKRDVGKRLERENIKLEDPDKELLGKVGLLLIEIFVERTNLVHKPEPERRGDDKYKIYYLDPTDELLELLEKQHEYFAWLNTTLPPMVVPPRPWTEEGVGGYYLITNPKTFMVRNKDPEGAEVDYDEFITAKHDQEAYDAINTVQNTAWRINRKVYEVMSNVWSDGGGKEWKLPYSEDVPEPLCTLCGGEVDHVKKNHPCFKKKKNKKFLDDWKYKKKLWHEEKADNKSKRTKMTEKLRIAKAYLGELEIYFPHAFDFRGRMSALSLFINPQEDDTGRALLEFAEGKPVKNEEAIKWLKVHGANCYGKDKKSIADRVAWVDAKEEMIKRIAENPYKNHEWLKADRKHEWKFLAWCFDYAAWLEDPENHLSHLPVAVDGKCNGHQHYAAMLRDKDGGEAVCLTKSTEDDTPVDIYQKVANLVNEKIEKDAANGNELAKLWLGEDDKSKVKRSIVKKPVMNYPYGISPWKVWKEIANAIKDIEEEAKEKPGEKIKFITIPDHLKNKVTFNEAINYMRDKVGETTEEVVTSAKTAMDWLKAVAALPNIINYYGWISPIGFHVNHMYYETKRKKVRVTPLGGTEIEMSYRERKLHVSYEKMKDALPPNFVHSLDASHLMMTVLKCKKAGIDSFGMVHDSYASHAANIPLMLKLLKEAFVELHKRDVLAEFREQIASGIDAVELVGEEEVTDDWGDGTVSTYTAPKYASVDGEEYIREIESKLKEPLKTGKLDINEVLKSTYFFA